MDTGIPPRWKGFRGRDTTPLAKLTNDFVGPHTYLIVIGGVAVGSKAAARAHRVTWDIAIPLFQDESKVSYSACEQA